MDKLAITRESDPERSVFRFTGPFTLEGLFSAQDALRSDTAPLTILDLHEVPYIDSAGIGALVNAHVSREKQGHRLVLVGVTERVRKTLEITRVAQVFWFANSVADVGTIPPPTNVAAKAG